MNFFNVPSFVIYSRRRYPTILVHSLEIDKSPIHINMNELYSQLMTDINAFKPAQQSSFDRRLKDTDPCSFIRSACTNGIKLVPDS